MITGFSGRTDRARRAMFAATVATLAMGSLASAQTFNIGIGVRESMTTAAIGANGGATGGIEFVGYRPEPAATRIAGKPLVADGSWQTITFTFGTDSVFAFAGATANGTLDGTRGALEHLGFQNSPGVTDRIAFFVDDIYNTPAGGVPTLIEDFESFPAVATPSNGAPEVVFRDPRLSGSTNASLVANDTGNVTAESAATGANSYRLGFQFNTGDISRWIRLTTNNTANKPNPAIEITPGSTLSFALRAIVIPELAGWNVDADSNWVNDANWLGGTPNALNAVARFGGAIQITQPRTVTVDQTVTVGSIVFNSAVPYTLASPSPDIGILLRASAGFDVLLSSENGSHTINTGLEPRQRLNLNVTKAADTLTIGNLITFDETAGGTAPGTNFQETVDLVKSGAGKAVVNPLKMNIVNVSGGTLQLASGGGASDVNQLTIAGTAAAPTAQLDITNNAVVINYTGAVSPLLTQRSRIAAGYAGGAGNGNGIISTALNATTAIGYAEASALGFETGDTFLGLSVDETSVLIRVTKRGDTNLDGTVDFTDLVALAQNYDAAYDPNGVNGPKVWSQGDSNYTGIVDFDDLVSLAQNYGSSLSTEQEALVGAAFAEDYQLALSLVPEPTTLATLGAASTLVMRRRRR